MKRKRRPGRPLSDSRHPHTLETRKWRARNREHHNWYMRNWEKMQKGLPVDEEFERKYAGKLKNQVRLETMVDRSRKRHKRYSHEVGISDDEEAATNRDRQRRKANDVPGSFTKAFGLRKSRSE